jgi:lipopolysaccharide biosynthesis regulator YciM
MYVNGWGDDRAWHKAQGLDLVERALVQGAEDASVLAQAADAVMELDRDLKRAASLAKRATALNPGCARGWFISGIINLTDGDAAGALEHFQMAARLDPISRFNDIVRAHLGIACAFSGDAVEGLNILRTTTHRTARIHLALAAIYGHLDRQDESQAEFSQFRALSTMSLDEMYRTLSPRSLDWLREGLERGAATGSPVLVSAILHPA